MHPSRSYPPGALSCSHSLPPQAPSRSCRWFLVVLFIINSFFFSTHRMGAAFYTVHSIYRGLAERVAVGRKIAPTEVGGEEDDDVGLVDGGEV